MGTKENQKTPEQIVSEAVAKDIASMFNKNSNAGGALETNVIVYKEGIFFDDKRERVSFKFDALNGSELLKDESMAAIMKIASHDPAVINAFLEREKSQPEIGRFSREHVMKDVAEGKATYLLNNEADVLEYAVINAIG